MTKQLTWRGILVVVGLSVSASALLPAAGQDWIAGVREAVMQALPFPSAAGLGRAANGDTTAEWVVAGAVNAAADAPIDLVRNRLNPLYQQRVTVHEQEAAALRDSLRVELRQADPAGLEQIDLLEARWRADGRLRITFEVAPAEPYSVDSAASPFVTPVPGVEAVVIAVRGNVYGYEAVAGARRQQKWREAEAIVFVGDVAAPTVARRPGYDVFEVAVSSAAPVLQVHLAGNEDLIASVIDTVDWAAVAARVP